MWYTVDCRITDVAYPVRSLTMNRKIQETDRAFIIARYRRDPHAFSARSEASAHDVSVRTIYNTLAQEGIQMRRGRKPLISPDPVELPLPPDFPDYPVHLRSPEPLKSLIPVDCSNFLIPPKPLNPPKPPVSQTRKGPPIIRPRERPDKNAD